MAASTSTVIGQSAFVRGRVSGEGDLEIAGRVEGDIACSGEVLIDTSALVAANVSGSRIVVRGAVKGDLVAEDAVVIEAGARVVGDLRAPRITIIQGGLVRGHVQTAGGGAARPRASSAAHATRTSASETKARPAPLAARPAAQRTPDVRPAPVAARPAPAASRPVRPAPEIAKAAPAPASRTNHVQKSDPRNERSNGGSAARHAGPPPPVVPVLKKGTKAVQKKRA